MIIMILYRNGHDGCGQALHLQQVHTYNCIAGEFGGLVICAAWATATIQHVCIDIIAAMVIIWDPIAKLNSC